uniref:Septin-7 n=1 Tax=Sarcophilus harrisii TaxID=9305 RepID=A0A7N4P6E8_SARHA
MSTSLRYKSKLVNPVEEKQDHDKQYVGFATLPNQVHRKSVKKGFDFTLMVAGEQCPAWLVILPRGAGVPSAPVPAPPHGWGRGCVTVWWGRGQCGGLGEGGVWQSGGGGGSVAVPLVDREKCGGMWAERTGAPRRKIQSSSWGWLGGSLPSRGHPGPAPRAALPRPSGHPAHGRRPLPCSWEGRPWPWPRPPPWASLWLSLQHPPSSLVTVPSLLCIRGVGPGEVDPGKQPVPDGSLQGPEAAQCGGENQPNSGDPEAHSGHRGEGREAEADHCGHAGLWGCRQQHPVVSGRGLGRRAREPGPGAGKARIQMPPRPFPSWKPITDYVDQQFEQYFRDESGLNRKNIQDNRVHCCLYFISPFGHGLRPVDVEFMKALHEKVNIVPLIAKADCLVPGEIRKLKERIREEIDKFGIKVYQFPECDSDEDEEFKQQDRELKESAPFAVIGSNTVVEAKGQRVRGRLYPWGIVEVENQAHCDFVKLRNMLIRTHMHDLKDVTCDVHYENYRAHCIQQMTRWGPGAGWPERGRGGKASQQPLLEVI